MSTVAFMWLLWGSLFFFYGVGALLSIVPFTWALRVTGMPFGRRVVLATASVVLGIAAFMAAGEVSKSVVVGFGIGTTVASTFPLLFQPRRYPVVLLGVAAVGLSGIAEWLADSGTPKAVWGVLLVVIATTWGAQFAVAAVPAEAREGQSTEYEEAR